MYKTCITDLGELKQRLRMEWAKPETLGVPLILKNLKDVALLKSIRALRKRNLAIGTPCYRRTSLGDHAMAQADIA